MDDYQRNLQADHAAKLKTERFIAQTYGVSRSQARAALKQARIDRQFAADRAKAAAPVARPPAPQVVVREVKVDVPKITQDEGKKQVIPNAAVAVPGGVLLGPYMVCGGSGPEMIMIFGTPAP